MKKLLLFFGFILVIGCNNSTKQSNKLIKKEQHSDLEYISYLKKRSIKEGNDNSFGDLIDYYNNKPSEYYELLPIAIIMADKYNSDRARVAIYFLFLQIENNGKRDEKQFFKLDKSKQDFIAKYLVDGAKNGSAGCLSIMEKLLGSGLKIDKKTEKELVSLSKTTTAKHHSKKL